MRLPAMRQHPSGDEIVIVGVELILTTPVLMREAVCECRILQNMCSVGDGSPGETGDASVQMGRGRDLEISPLQIQGAQKGPQVRLLRSTKPLARAHPAHIGLLIGSQDPRENGSRPGDVVVGEDGDLCADLRYGPAHLTALVCMGDAESTDARAWHGLRQLEQTLVVRVDGHQKDLKRLRGKAGSDGLAELVSATFKCRDDDCDILRAQTRVLRERDRPEGPMRDAVDN